MKKTIATILAALCCCVCVLAVPARRDPFTYTQPDGTTIVLQRHGDEFFNWTTDASGRKVEKGSDGFYRPVDEAAFRSRAAAARIRRSAVNEGRRRPRRGPSAMGSKRYLVILVEFDDDDVRFANGRQAFDDMLNKPGYSANGATGSARDFYYDNSHGAFEPIFDVFGPVTLSNDRAYYGANDSRGNDSRPADAVFEGCQALDEAIDFSRYDNDNDGEVDLVFMYYAGKGEADGGPEDSIWPHQWSLSSAGLSLVLDGKTVSDYACTNEIVGYGNLEGQLCGIGTACHEFGHAMGLPDMYDTDYDTYNGLAEGLYDYSTMCSGSYNNDGRTPPYFNTEERILLGWLDDTAITEITSPGLYTLPGVNDNAAYKSATDYAGEYYLYECRTREGWDAYIPEAGLIVYHVDKSDRPVSIHHGGTYKDVAAKTLWDEWGRYNCLNENGSHPCFYIVPAGAQDSFQYKGRQFAFPGAARQYSFTGTSWSDGGKTEVRLSDIFFSGSEVTFTATLPSSTLNYTLIANPGDGVYSAGASFPLQLAESPARPVSQVQWYFDDEPVSGSSVTLAPGTHVVEAHITFQGGRTAIQELTIQVQ